MQRPARPLVGWRNPTSGHIIHMVFFHGRRRAGPGRWLPVRLAALIVGGLLGLVGMRFNNSLLVSVAIGVVLVGFLLRFLPKPTDDAGHGEVREPPDPTES